MAYVKAATSQRARRYLATVEGRRKLLTVYLGGAANAVRPESPDSDRATESTGGRTSLTPKK